MSEEDSKRAADLDRALLDGFDALADLAAFWSVSAEQRAAAEALKAETRRLLGGDDAAQ